MEALLEEAAQFEREAAAGGLRAASAASAAEALRREAARELWRAVTRGDGEARMRLAARFFDLS